MNPTLCHALTNFINLCHIFDLFGQIISKQPCGDRISWTARGPIILMQWFDTFEVFVAQFVVSVCCKSHGIRQFSDQIPSGREILFLLVRGRERFGQAKRNLNYSN